ncbi:phage integrase N-terminal SAM-like domain-containing protein [Mycolicibacterium sp. ND9-15]|uniref:phage integrase N-terminal SAM-like domain-containing protein n=1 Tax=Mycolicibacterium sp. ND9-15 TaxID=3042320 RepID=UPI002DDB4F84|nr:phage integrase N-terminal SAM-like domain-containing protein [Mycolicibacterium sp. ND9-15]WSE56190.1 phage integrase N-terminal SAM-like domain-containing protein [Mycolicibacterium sp. ND9-15]
MAADMVEELPGFIPQVLRRDDVSLLRADETVFNAMVDGWRAQMLARGLATDTIKGRCGVVSRFVEFTNECPWRWRPLDVDRFLVDLRSRETPIALSTLRSYSNAISMFCSYVSDNGYGWVTFCEKQFGDVPSQICFEWNTPQHTTDDAVPPNRRTFTKSELQHMFDVVDDFVDEQHRNGSKRWMTVLPDSIGFKIGYAYWASTKGTGQTGSDRLRAQSARAALRRLRRTDRSVGKGHEGVRPPPANGADSSRVPMSS